MSRIPNHRDGYYEDRKNNRYSHSSEKFNPFQGTSHNSDVVRSRLDTKRKRDGRDEERNRGNRGDRYNPERDLNRYQNARNCRARHDDFEDIQKDLSLISEQSHGIAEDIDGVMINLGKLASFMKNKKYKDFEDHQEQIKMFIERINFSGLERKYKDIKMVMSNLNIIY